MMLLTLFILTTVGEWIDANPGATIAIFLEVAALIFAAGGFGYLIRQIRLEVKKLCDVVDANEKTMTDHIANDDEHVNHEYMKTLKERIERVETHVKESTQSLSSQMTAQHEKLSDKVDTKFDAIMSRVDSLLLNKG